MTWVKSTRFAEQSLAAAIFFFAGVMQVHGTVIEVPPLWQETVLFVTAGLNFLLHATSGYMEKNAVLTDLFSAVLVASTVGLHWTVSAYRSTPWITDLLKQRVTWNASHRRLFMNGVPASSWLWLWTGGALFLRLAQAMRRSPRAKQQEWKTKAVQAATLASCATAAVSCIVITQRVGSSRCLASLCYPDTACTQGQKETLQEKILAALDGTECDTTDGQASHAVLLLSIYVGADSVSQIAVDVVIVLVTTCFMLVSLRSAILEPVRDRLCDAICGLVTILVGLSGRLAARVEGWDWKNSRAQLVQYDHEALVVWQWTATVGVIVLSLCVYVWLSLGIWVRPAEKAP